MLNVETLFIVSALWFMLDITIAAAQTETPTETLTETEKWDDGLASDRTSKVLYDFEDDQQVESI